MFLFVKQTLIRGRSFVPWIFFRTRQWRRSASLCFCSVLIVKSSSCALLDRLAFLADDAFVAIPHTLAFVRLRRVEGADFGRDLSNDLLARPFNRQFRVFLNGHFDLSGYGINDRMRVAEAQINSVALHSRFEAD